MYKYQMELWEAINEYTEACGGDASSRTASRARRISAVVGVEEIIEKLRFASQQGQSSRPDSRCICEPYYANQGIHSTACPLYKSGRR